MRHIVKALLLTIITIAYSTPALMAQVAKKPIPNGQVVYVPNIPNAPQPVYQPTTNQTQDQYELQQINQQLEQIKQQMAQLRQQQQALRARQHAILVAEGRANGNYNQDTNSQQHDNGKHKGWYKNGKAEQGDQEGDKQD